jgi:hypothetical protein
LYEESIAAHAEARRLDPNVSTSDEQTVLMTDDLERLLAVEALSEGEEELAQGPRMDLPSTSPPANPAYRPPEERRRDP